MRTNDDASKKNKKAEKNLELGHKVCLLARLIPVCMYVCASLITKHR